jgi:hypothetical protein
MIMEKENSMLPYHLSQQSVRFEILLQYYHITEKKESNQIGCLVLSCIVFMFVFYARDDDDSNDNDNGG